MKRKKQVVPKILPREPLTKKAKRAIMQYVEVKLKGQYLFHLAVLAVLEAERMRRVDLYAWLEKRGFRWDSRVGLWEKKVETGKQNGKA